MISQKVKNRTIASYNFNRLGCAKLSKSDFLRDHQFFFK